MLPAIRPDLDGASVAGLVPALFARPRHAWLPAVARDAQQVVLLVLDGLGWTAVQEHGALMPTIAGMEGGRITTVVPSTTATALTSIATGFAPAQHGVMGYRMVVAGEVLNVLRWDVPDGRRAPEPFDVQRQTAFMGRDVPVVTKHEFRKTGFTQAHLRGGRFVGWQTTSTIVEHCRTLVAAGEPFVYAYYPGVDTVAHAYGLHDGYYARELRATDALVAELLDALPATATLCITSDHGQVHLDPGDWRDVRALEPFVETMAGDGRFRYLYAKRGQAKDLAAAAHDAFDDCAWVMTRRELLDGNWYGSGATGTVPGRIGDVVLAARDAIAFVDPALPSEASLRSGHGSLTPDEMYVPLLAARGRA